MPIHQEYKSKNIIAYETKDSFLPLLFVAIAAIAETSLIVQPLTGDEQAQALSTIGYVKVTSDSLFIYSHSDMLLGKSAIKDIHHIRYGEPKNQDGIDDVNITTCRVYPNPTQDMLVIDDSDADEALIFDLNGRLLQTNLLYGEKATINVSSLPKGEYLLLLNTQTFKFIKQ